MKIKNHSDLLEKIDFWRIKQIYFNNKDTQEDDVNKTEQWDVTDKEAASSAVFHLTTYYYVRKLISVWFKNQVRASLQAIGHQSLMPMFCHSLWDAVA